jgi:serine protease
MTISPIVRRVVWLAVPVAAIAATVGLWSGRPSRPTEAKTSPGVADQAALAAAMAQQGRVTLIVDYRDDFSAAERDATPEDERAISRWSDDDKMYRVSFPTYQEAAAAAARLAGNPRVESVDWDVEAAIPPGEWPTAAAPGVLDGDRSMQSECGGAPDGAHAGFPSDPCYRYQWHLGQVGLPGAWKLGQGEGVIVAVIDTGVSRVPDLAQTPFVPGFNFVDNNDRADDDHGHGTHVAGTIAQSTNNKLGVGGVAFGASIMPLKVLSARGSGSMAAIAQAIRYAADHGARVINMSLGGPFPVGAIGNAVKYAHGKGVTVVAAAGNDGRGKVSYPARYPGVIAVAATQFDETTTFYSNWGSQVDIAAPGGNVRVDQNGDGKPDGVLQNTVVPGNTSRTDYLWFMGTSMASPHVAGVAALVVGAGITKPDAVEQVLLDTARRPKGHGEGSGGARVDDHYGAGLVDAGAALKKVRAGRGAGELGLGGAAALLGIAFLTRGGRGRARLGGGFLPALVLGAGGLFWLPMVLPSSIADTLFGGGSGLAAPLLSGVLGGIDSWLRPGFGGNLLVWSALLPVGLTAVLYGVGKLRGPLAGLGFGIAGALAFAGLAGAFDVRGVPDLLDRTWLFANAAIATLTATAVLRR